MKNLITVILNEMPAVVTRASLPLASVLRKVQIAVQQRIIDTPPVNAALQPCLVNNSGDLPQSESFCQTNKVLYPVGILQTVYRNRNGI